MYGPPPLSPHQKPHISILYKVYANEKSVGQGIKESGLPRSDLFITTKYSGIHSIRTAIRASLSKLGVEHLDLYLVHFPKTVIHDPEGSWRIFEEIKEQGYVQSVHLSLRVDLKVILDCRLSKYAR
jgi:diketogulonate reductase-like aldo/keto reductase